MHLLATTTQDLSVFISVQYRKRGQLAWWEVSGGEQAEAAVIWKEEAAVAGLHTLVNGSLTLGPEEDLPVLTNLRLWCSWHGCA